MGLTNWLGWLASEPGIYLFMSLQSWDYKLVISALLSTSVLGIELRSSRACTANTFPLKWCPHPTGFLQELNLCDSGHPQAFLLGPSFLFVFLGPSMLNSGLCQVFFSSQCLHLRDCQICTFLGPAPYLLSQKVLRWDFKKCPSSSMHHLEHGVISGGRGLPLPTHHPPPVAHLNFVRNSPVL